MKTSIIFVAIFSSFIAFGQNEAFNKIVLQQTHGREVIKFTPIREVNVRNYRIEASNDGTNFDIIATIPAKGNPVLASTYSYDLSAYSYAYYRVGQVGMGGQMPYSPVVTNKQAAPVNEPKESQPVIAPGAAVVNN